MSNVYVHFSQISFSVRYLVINFQLKFHSLRFREVIFSDIYINKPIGELCRERFYRENVSDFPWWRQSRCDYFYRSQSAYLKMCTVRGNGERNPHQDCQVNKNHEVSFELLGRILLWESVSIIKPNWEKSWEAFPYASNILWKTHSSFISSCTKIIIGTVRGK